MFSDCGVLVDGAGVVAGVEDLEVERAGGAGAPEPQGVDGAAAVARDHRVVGDAEDGALGEPADAVAAVRVGVALGVAAEADLDRHLGVGELPGVAAPEPVVGLFDLPAVLEGLAEDAELVADAVADGGDAEGGEGVEVAGGQPPEAAVAEAGLGLQGAQLVEAEAEVGEGLAGEVFGVGVEQVVVELAADQVLGREVADESGLAIDAGVEGIEPALDQAVADGVGQGEVRLARGGEGEVGADAVVEVLEELAAEGGDGRGGWGLHGRGFLRDTGPGRVHDRLRCFRAPGVSRGVLPRNRVVPGLV